VCRCVSSTDVFLWVLPSLDSEYIFMRIYFLEQYYLL
jgi:hypothetical protein